jgi:uncharacterized protein YdaU (DUF1376 family)
MRKPSHIPLFPDAYLRDNFRMSLEQHGLFFMLMMEAWNTDDCSLPDSDKALAEIAGISVAKFRKIAPQVLEKWTREGGRIFQKRLVKEWNYVREKSGKRKAAADARWQQQNASKCNASAMHLGGGEGEGGGVPYQAGNKGDTLDERPFRVVEGGGK